MDKHLAKTFQLTVCNKEGNVTLQGFLALWSMTTLLDYKKTLHYLAYLGFEDVPKALSITRGRKADIKKKSISRNVFHGYVFGSPGCGKSTFLNGLLGKPFEVELPSTVGTRNAVNAVYLADGSEKYLVLSEFENEEDIYQSKEKMDQCDLVVFLYDCSDAKSFSHVAKIHNLLIEGSYNLPIVFFATKSDLEAEKQSYEITPQKFCANLAMLPPKPISIKSGVEPDLYNGLVQLVHQHYSSSSHWALFIGVGVVVTLIAGGLIYWKFKKN